MDEAEVVVENTMEAVVVVVAVVASGTHPGMTMVTGITMVAAAEGDTEEDMTTGITTAAAADTMTAVDVAGDGITMVLAHDEIVAVETSLSLENLPQTRQLPVLG